MGMLLRCAVLIITPTWLAVLSILLFKMYLFIGDEGKVLLVCQLFCSLKLIDLGISVQTSEWGNVGPMNHAMAHIRAGFFFFLFFPVSQAEAE